MKKPQNARGCPKKSEVTLKQKNNRKKRKRRKTKTEENENKNTEEKQEKNTKKANATKFIRKTKFEYSNKQYGTI